MDIIYTSNVGNIRNISEDLYFKCNEANYETSLNFVGFIKNPVELFKINRALILLIHTDQDGEFDENTYNFMKLLIMNKHNISEQYRFWNTVNPSIFFFGCGNSKYNNFNMAVQKAVGIYRDVLHLNVNPYIGMGDARNDFGIYSAFDPWSSYLLSSIMPILDIPVFTQIINRKKFQEYQFCQNIYKEYEYKTGYINNYITLSSIESVYLFKLHIKENWDVNSTICILPKTNWIEELVEKLPYSNIVKARSNYDVAFIIDRCEKYIEQLHENQLLKYKYRLNNGIDIYSKPSRFWLYLFSKILKDKTYIDKAFDMISSAPNGLSLYYSYVVESKRGRIDILHDFLIQEAADDDFADKLLYFVTMTLPVLQHREYSVASSNKRIKFNYYSAITKAFLYQQSYGIYSSVDIIVKINYYNGHNYAIKHGLCTKYLNNLKDNFIGNSFSYLIDKHSVLTKVASQIDNSQLYGFGTGISCIRAILMDEYFKNRCKPVNCIVTYTNRYDNNIRKELEIYCINSLFVCTTAKYCIYTIYVSTDQYKKTVSTFKKPHIGVVIKLFKHLYKEKLTNHSIIYISGRSHPTPQQLKKSLMSLDDCAFSRNYFTTLWD